MTIFFKFCHVLKNRRSRFIKLILQECLTSRNHASEVHDHLQDRVLPDQDQLSSEVSVQSVRKLKMS